MDLTIIWAFLIAFAVAAYVVMDGFDLGIGILFPLFRVGRERDQAMNSIAPVWDGNETWLVLGGGGLLAAFPLAYAIVLPALYAPLTFPHECYGLYEADYDHFSEYVAAIDARGPQAVTDYIARYVDAPATYADYLDLFGGERLARQQRAARELVER